MLVLLYYDYTFYIYLESGEEEQPLLDTNFPDISFQKEGMQLKTYRGGVPGCEELRRISIWKVVNEFGDEGSDDEAGAPVSSVAGKHDPTELRADAKQLERRREEGVKASVGDGSEDKTSGVSKSGEMQSRKTALPHHIAPLKQPSGGAAATLKKMPDLGLKAPWDETGRPLGQRTSK